MDGGARVREITAKGGIQANPDGRGRHHGLDPVNTALSVRVDDLDSATRHTRACIHTDATV